MGLIEGDRCERCNATLRQGERSRRIGVEYSLTTPEHYDGVSEWRCPVCGLRVGRWSGKRLEAWEREARFGGQA